MTPPDANSASANQILDQEISALEAVLNALESEHEALEARNAEALTAASELKLSCIETARRIGAERAQLLPSETEIAADPAVSLRWEKVVKLARSCKEKNDRNGMLIRWQHRYIEQTLAVLRNEPADGKLYGPGGESERVAGRRRGTLGSA